MMKKLLLSFTLLLLALQASAQFGGDKPVTVTPSVNVVGEKCIVTFDAEIADGYHLYSTTDAPNPTTITIIEAVGAERVGNLTPVGETVSEYDEMFEMNVSYFEGFATFTQEFKLLGGEYRIKGVVKYQYCTDGACRLGQCPVEYTGVAAVAQPAEPVNTPVKEEPAQAVTAPVNPEPAPAAPVVAPEATEEPAVESAEVETAPVATPETEQPATSDETDIWASSKAELAQLDSEKGSVTTASTSSNSLWMIFLLGFGGGLIALLTPCVWPIIPMTVSFFLKRSKQRGQAIREAMIYGVSIVVIYLVLGLAVTLIFGAGALNALSTNAYFNIFFFLMLVVFGASFLGGFELTLPSSWTNKVDEKAGNTTGLLSIFLMAFTLVLVSFSCTGPIIGFLLVEMTSAGAIFGPALGMFGFALALALPFTLFAIFPSLLKQAPRSGGWMNTIKVVLGFVEIAFAFKFLSVADLTMHWGLLDRETFLAIWIVLFALLGLYLLKVIRFPHDDADDKTTSVPGFFTALLSLAFAVYMIPGLWGAPCNAISAFAPPVYTQDFNLYDETFKADTDDYETAIMMSRNEGKPIMLDFTGHGCVNCREMESKVLSNDSVAGILRDKYIVVSLYVDDRKPLATPYEVEVDGEKMYIETVGDQWMYLQSEKFGSTAQPFYVLVDGNGKPLTGHHAHDTDVSKFVQFLQAGETEYKNRQK